MKQVSSPSSFSQALHTLNLSDVILPLCDRAQIALCILDDQGRILQTNPGFEALYGWSTSEIAGQPLENILVLPEGEAEASLGLNQAAAGSSQCLELAICCRSGAIRQAQMTAERVEREGNLYTIGIWMDITERKQAQASLQQANETLRQRVQEQTKQLSSVVSHLRTEIGDRRRIEADLRKEREFLNALLESVEAGIVACDANGTLTLFNRATREFHGLPAEPLPADQWAEYYDLYLPDGRPMTMQDIPLFRALSGERVENVEMIIAPRQGATRTLLTNGRMIVDPAGHRLGAVVAMHDITQRKAAETALRESEQALRQQAERLEETLRDLQKTQTHLVQSEKMSSLGQLVAGIAHEINNPINFIYGNLAPASQYVEDLLHLIDQFRQHYPTPPLEIQDEIEAIDLEFVTEDLPKLVASMRVGADRIRQIVLSLRNFSRVDEAECKPVDIHEGIDSTLMILQNRLKLKAGQMGIQLVKEYSRLPKVECYAGQLNQVFMNLLSNAIDALEEWDGERSAEAIAQQPSQITITTRSLTEFSVAIHIRDNGPGISPAVQQRIFSPFFTTKPMGKGTGLGLSISHQIVVDRHGGILQCISEPGKGTEFIIEIPVSQRKGLPEAVA